MNTEKYHVTTVKELIEKLNKYSPDTKVVIKEGEDTLESCSTASTSLDIYTEVLDKVNLYWTYSPEYFKEGETIVVIFSA